MRCGSAARLAEEAQGVAAQQEIALIRFEAQRVDTLQGLAILDHERMVRAEAKLRDPESIDQVPQGGGVINQRVVEQRARLLPRRSLVVQAEMVPAGGKSRQGQREAARPVAERDAQPRMPVENAAGDQRYGSERCLARERDELPERR